MRPPAEQTFNCEGCGKPGSLVCWSALNATQQPAEREALLQGRLTRFECLHCGWTGQAIYPLLYHDTARRFMVWLQPRGETPDTAGLSFARHLENHRLRRVAHPNELIEKILIFEAGLDDRPVEVVKVLLATQTPDGGRTFRGDLFFQELRGAADNDRQVIFECHGPDGEARLIQVPWVQFSALGEATLREVEPSDADSPEDWPLVNRDYAHKIVQAMLP